MSDEFKWITTNRSGRCTSCDREIVSGERVLWSLRNKANIWCLQCGSVNSTDTEGKGKQSTGASVVNNASEGICARVRWEIVTGDDGIIVLRRLP